MTQWVAFTALALSLAVGSGRPALAEEGSAGVEDELKALVRATTRLVESFERQERELEIDRDLRRVAIAVQILDIRAGQHDGLRKELQALDDREQQILGNIAANAARMETIDRQLPELIDEAKKMELKARRAEIEAYTKNSKQQLEHVARRRADIDGLLTDERRLVRDVEGIVDAWLLDLQQGLRKKSGE